MIYKFTPNQLYDFIVQLKLNASDGKKYSTDCADTEGILRIIEFDKTLEAIMKVPKPDKT